MANLQGWTNQVAQPPRPNTHISIKRCRGLGNLICLLPVLRKLCIDQAKVTVYTRPEWVDVMAALDPEVRWLASDADGHANAVDLDTLTLDIKPCRHRTDEFGKLLDVAGPYPPLHLNVPEQWSYAFEALSGQVILAPESGHPSRSWPYEKCQTLFEQITDRELILVGLRRDPPIACDIDLRGSLDVQELIGVLAVAGVVVTMDSAVLHIAAALGKPTVAIFGGIDPCFRVAAHQPVVILQAHMDCCPCNKIETCNGLFPCIAAPEPRDVLQAMEIARVTQCRVIRYLTRVGELVG